MAVAISFELGEFSFMWTGHDQRACHSPWMEPVFRATDSHNHTNPHKPPSAWALCCQGHRLPQKKKKQFVGAGACCDHWCQNGYERQVLCSLWYLSGRGRAGEEMWPQRQVSQVDCVVLNWSMHASKGDNTTHCKSAQKRKSGAQIYIEWKVCQRQHFLIRDVFKDSSK